MFTQLVRSATGAFAVAGAVLGLVASPAAAASVGAPGAGDPYFPLQGNGGYDVAHYGLDLRYDPVSGRLDGRAAITARATGTLSRFDLDLRRDLTVSAVSVDGVPARFSQPAQLEQELVVTPARSLGRGERFTVVVTYGGVPPVITDPDGSIEGMVPTEDGVHTVGEPQGSPGWFPCNDSPRDKAIYDVRVSVPEGLVAVSNGDLVAPPRTAHGRTTFRWHNGEPMATYLSTVTIGRFDVSTGATPSGIPYYVAVDPTVAPQSKTVLGKLPAMVDFYQSVYGRYPFSSAGAVVDPAPEVGYALENQTKPVFDGPPSELTLAHELAHQWYGDSVTLGRWRDIWLNEGFAEFSAWLWSEHIGQRSAQQFFTRLYHAHSADDDDFWNPPPGDPGGPENIFAGSVYERGAMTLQALRVTVGGPTFFRIMRGWYASNLYGNARVEDFTRYAEKVSGRDLGAFFDAWLYTPGKPTSW